MSKIINVFGGCLFHSQSTNLRWVDFIYCPFQNSAQQNKTGGVTEKVVGHQIKSKKKYCFLKKVVAKKV